MKKRLCLLFIAVLSLSVVFSACTFGGKGDPLTLKYHESDIRTNIKALADDKGVSITISIAEETTDDNGENTIDPDAQYEMKYAACKDIYYFCDKEYEYYYDLALSTGYTTFKRNLNNGSWEKNIYVYSSDVTKENALAELDELTEDFFECMTSHVGFEGQKMTKASSEIAGRTCDKYSLLIKIFGIGTTYSVDVDTQTGACLGISCDVTGANLDSNISVFTCTDFKTDYNPVLPVIEALD